MSEEENTYLLDPEAEAEMIRLAQQGQFFNEVYGLLPPNIDFLRLPSVLSVPLEERHMPRVLDLGSATGEWPLALAAKYRQAGVFEILGVDISERMVIFARQQALNQELQFLVQFQVVNALKPLPFDDEHFDLIQLRIANSFIPRTRWEDVFRECWRVLRPQGILISTEPETGTTTFHNPATAQVMRWFAQVLYVNGLGFWDGVGSHIGIHAMQPEFFRATGFENIEIFPTLCFTSSRSPHYLMNLQIGEMLLQNMESLVMNLGVSKEEFHRICEMKRLEELQDTYQSYSTIVSITGRKGRKAK